MKVVLDTNVLVSGLGWKSGPPGRILDAWTAQAFKVVVTDEIFEEYQEVLSDFAERHSGLNADAILGAIVSSALWVSPEPLVGPICADPDDDMFLAAAIAGKARYIVSGDKALLLVRSLREIEIVTPARFLLMIRNWGSDSGFGHPCK